MRDQLFAPLGILRYDWWQDEEPVLLGGYGLQLTAQDLARFGLLYLEEGRWQDQQLLPQAWVRESTRIQHAGGAPVQQPYALYWWVAEQAGLRIIMAAGVGGQRIYLVPERDLLVVTLADLDSGTAPDQIIWRFLAGVQ